MLEVFDEDKAIARATERPGDVEWFDSEGEARKEFATRRDDAAGW